MATQLFSLLVLTVALAIVTGLPMNEPFGGHFTYYDDVGYGACGQPLNAASDVLVAISPDWFTSDNPNNDPACGYCLKVDYNGASITVPIKDKCAACEKDHMDLSLPAFSSLENLSVGDAQGATFTFVDC